MVITQEVPNSSGWIGLLLNVERSSYRRWRCWNTSSKYSSRGNRKECGKVIEVTQQAAKQVGYPTKEYE